MKKYVGYEIKKIAICLHELAKIENRIKREFNYCDEKHDVLVKIEELSNKLNDLQNIFK